MQVQIIQPDQAGELKATHEFDHGYPVTRVRWSLDAVCATLLHRSHRLERAGFASDDGRFLAHLGSGRRWRPATCRAQPSINMTGI